MEKPNVSAAIRRTRRNVIAMGKLLGVAVFGIALSPRGADAAATGGKPCFLKGTRIRVVGGEKKIEDIRIGDMVVTRSGQAKPVRWVARRRYRKPGLEAMKLRCSCPTSVKCDGGTLGKKAFSFGIF